MQELLPGTVRDQAAQSERWLVQIGRIASKDQSALAEFYDETSRLAFGLILRVINDRSTAEEVLLDVYSQVWRKATDYSPERGSPLAWLMTIARTRALDRLRSTRVELSRKEPLEAVGEKAASSISPEEASFEREQQRVVRSALAKLSEDQRKAIELAFFGGLSHSEIADHLGQPLGTVKTRIRLGMMKLKDELAPLRTCVSGART